jgi:gas vesicle protein
MLPKIIEESIAGRSNSFTDFWKSVGKAIESAIEKVQATGANLADKISEEFDEIKNKINAIVAPIKTKVQIILRDLMPKLAAKAKIVIHDAQELAKQVGTAILEILKKLGHDALVEAKKWLEANHELVEKLLFKFLTEQLPKYIQDAMSTRYSLATPYNGWTDFWDKVGKAIGKAVDKVKETGHDLADKISDEFDEIKNKVNAIIAPIKTKVQIIMRDVMPVIAAKAKIVIHDAKQLAIQVGKATLEILKKLGHDALVEAQKWLEKNHELVEKLLFKFLTEQLPKMIMDSIKSYSVATYNGWTDFWEKVGKAIEKAVDKVKATGDKLADKISDEFDELKEKINGIVAPVKAKVEIILRDLMPKIAAKAKIIIHDGGELAKQVGTATLKILKKLGHDALVEAQKWLEKNHELVEKLLFKFLTEQLPKMIMDSANSY